jgi:acyl-coenzyme A synthetase/AMP-(fatty) acid ligase
MLSGAQWTEARRRLTSDLWSLYGATEAELISFTPLGETEDLLRHRISPGCDLQIVDERHQPLPRGAVGALRARPTRVASYLNDPEGSARFFRDGYFYPGDTGAIGEDGYLRLHGRTTEVINVLGDKVGVLPIEAALRDALKVRDVCLIAAMGAQGEELHVAIETDASLSLEALRAALASALPRGVAQVRAHKVDHFPRNAMGKVERAKLLAQLTSPPKG